MKQYQITLANRTFDVKVLDDPRQEQVRVEVDGETFSVGVKTVSLAGEAPQALAPVSGQTSVVSSQTLVAAPLPGAIKSIAVRSGQRVAANDVLLVIEAMKMDNVIRAPREGVVGALYVAEGRQVAYDAPLLDLD